LPGLLALWEEAYRPRPDEALCPRQKPVERGAAARRHDIEDTRRQRIDSGVPNFHGCTGDPRGLAQKGAFPRVGFDELDPGHPHDRQHQPGEPGAAAEINEALRVGRNMEAELRRIEEMPAPRVDESAGGDEVDAPRPRAEQRRIGLEPRQCFT
jgi:hypothetical protein